jgi:hypothetical protein
MPQAERFPTSVGGPAAIDHQRVAVDEAAGLVVGKKGNGASNMASV